MKRTIAIVAGGDSSELPVSLRSAQGIYSFIDKERYNLYIVEMDLNIVVEDKLIYLIKLS